MKPRILYCGDTHLHDAAAYLAGLMTSWNWSFEYLPSDTPCRQENIHEALQLVIISDYPAELISNEVQHLLIERVESGCGLLMIGGWESFHGLSGRWEMTPIADILPVGMLAEDDRVNCDRPVLLAPCCSHPILENLPWETRPPIVGGFNAFLPKPKSDVLIESVTYRAHWQADRHIFEQQAKSPMLVVGHLGNGRTAALATDVAPHWVGPLVDWGDLRIQAAAENANPVEVGNLYGQFFRQLLGWTANF